MQLAKNISRLGTESAFKILAEAKKLEAEGKKIIHLSLGQPDFKSPSHVVEATKKALDEGHHGYVLPNGIIECRQAVSRKIKSLYNSTIDPKDPTNPEFGNIGNNDWYVFTGLTISFTFGDLPCYCKE